jgi:hypothetical protein
MTEPIDPIGRIPNTRRLRRRASDPLPDDVERSTLPVPVAPVREEPRTAPRDERRGAAAHKPTGTTLDAHLIGQDHRRRGLRAGQPALDEARATYLGAEYSGAADRRPRPGLIKKTDI